MKPENVHAPTTTQKQSTQANTTKTENPSTKSDFWGALLASASRRKSVPPSSPLCSVQEEAEPSSSQTTTAKDSEANKDRDGDVKMADTGPPEAFINPIVTLKEVIRKSKRSKGAKATLIEELPALERVRSRDSGYASSPDALH